MIYRVLCQKESYGCKERVIFTGFKSCVEDEDEDVLIPAEQFDLCHQVMQDFGMQATDPEQDIQVAFEVPYGKPGSPIYIELHKCLFPPESKAYGDLNCFFKGA